MTKEFDGRAIDNLAWSPDSNTIAFDQAYLQGKLTCYQILSVKPDFSEPPIAITQATGNEDRRPAWSPDGKQIVYESCCKNNSALQLYRVNPDGSNFVQITDPSVDPGFDKENPQWSPDGKYILFTESKEDCQLVPMACDQDYFDHPNRILVLDTNSSKVIPVTAIGSNGFPYWLPDSQHILYESQRKDKYGSRIYIADLISMTETLVSDDLTIDPAIFEGAVWVPLTR